MSLETALSFIDAYLIALVVLCVIYLINNNISIFKITLYILLLELFSRAIFTSVLKLPYANFVWYLTWAFLAALLMFFVIQETKKNPHLQKVTMPISFLILVVIFLELGRYFERNYSELEFIKSIYPVGSTAVNWLIVAYIFAPIALLLVKSIKSRYSA